MHSLIETMTLAFLVLSSSLSYRKAVWDMWRYVFMHVDMDVISDWSLSVRNASPLWYKSDWISRMSRSSPWEPEKMSKHNLWPQELLNGETKQPLMFLPLIFDGFSFTRSQGGTLHWTSATNKQTTREMTINSIFIITQRWWESLESLTRHGRHGCAKFTG